MIQQSDLKLICNDHKEEINMICYNQLCTNARLNCCICIQQGNHIQHPQEIKGLKEFIENNNKECDNLIFDLNKQVETVNQSFSNLKIGIRKKYQLPKERLLKLNSGQLNDYFKSLIQLNEYKYSATTFLARQIEKLTQAFQALYEQLNLSTVNQVQINDNDKQQSEQLYNEGFNLSKHGKYQEAIQQFNKSIQLDQNNYLALCYKGQCLRLLHKNDEAIICLDKALVIHPKHVISLCNKGECLRQLDKCEDAIIQWDKALFYDPKHVPSLCDKGECLVKLKKYDDALKCLNQALSISPDDTFSLKNKGRCLELQGNYLEAQICYKNLCQLETSDQSCQWAQDKIELCNQKIKQ